jgi:integrase/recombinase XerD
VNHCHPVPLGRSGSLDSQPSWPRDNRPGLVDDLIRVSVNLGANLVMNPNGARRRLRLHEKGGKEHEMPVHHLLEEILNEYIVAAGLQSGQPLFQSVNSLGTAVTGRALNRYNAWAAIRKRARAAGFLTPVGCHTWRATGITIYLENDGRLEHAQQMAGHESPRTTKLYDRTKDEITLSEVERIRL